MPCRSPPFSSAHVVAALLLAMLLLPSTAEAAKFRFRMPAGAAAAPSAGFRPGAGMAPYVATRAAIAGAAAMVGGGTPGTAEGKGPVYAIAAEQPPRPAPPPAEKTFGQKWAEFCKPTLGPADRFGVERFTYAHEGCQFGRTE